MYDKPRMRYDAAYISYVESGDSAAVFIARDIARAVPTGGKWIDVLSSDGRKRHDGRWDFREFTVELFPRLTQPVYTPGASKALCDYICWQAAHADIAAQRSRGVRGPRYRICPRLVNRNAGKYEVHKAAWNRRLQRWVPDRDFSPSCVWMERKQPAAPDWQYVIDRVEPIGKRS